eukprot:s795_g3.t1
MVAAHLGKVSILSLLIDASCNLEAENAAGATALVAAAEGGQVESARRLLEAKADVNHVGAMASTPLFAAVQDTANAGVQLQSLLELSSPGHDARTAVLPSIPGKAVLLVDGHHEVVQCLLDAGADADHVLVNGASSLMLAAQLGDTESVLALLQAGAQVDKRDGDGSTALILASQEGHEEACLKIGLRQSRPDQLQHIPRCGSFRK